MCDRWQAADEVSRKHFKTPFSDFAHLFGDLEVLSASERVVRVVRIVMQTQ
jgi:hypothetical protein